MSDDTIIASITKNSRETLRISLGSFKDHRLCHLRVWAGNNGDAVPTKSGFGIQAGLIRPLREALEKAEREARALGWLDAGAVAALHYSDRGLQR